MSVTTFHDREGYLILQYEPTDGNGRIIANLDNEGWARIRKTFHVTPQLRRDIPDDENDFIDEDFEPLEFEIGLAIGDYFLLHRNVLQVDYDLCISRDIQLETRHFIAVRDISL